MAAIFYFRYNIPVSTASQKSHISDRLTEGI